MFGFLKPDHVKKTEFIANTVSGLFKAWYVDIAGPAILADRSHGFRPLSSVKELRIYSYLIPDFYKELVKSKVLDSEEAYDRYISTHSKLLQAIKSGRIFGLQDIALIIVVDNFGLSESTTNVLNRIIQEMYKNELNRFVIEGRSYSLDEVNDYFATPTSREYFG